MYYGGLQGGFSVLGGGKPKPKVKAATSVMGVTPPPISGNKPVVKKKPYDMGAEFRQYGRTPLVFDEDRPVNTIVKAASEKAGINPSLLFSSAWQEGLNKAALLPDEISQGYRDHEQELADFPVDGFYNYGLDTIGTKYDKIKKYLPEGFENRLKFFETTNEKNEPIKTAAFKTNQDALTAKAAFLRSEMDDVENYAREKGIELDDNAKNYFTLASYNGGFGNAKAMLDEYAKAADKQKYLNEGLTSKKAIHKNIKSRLDNMKIADELLAEQ